MTYAIDDFLVRVRMTAGHLAPVLLTPTEAVALVAEVDRLRAAAQDERAAVVAWLQEWATPQSDWYDLSVRSSVLLEASDRIERGEHRREEER